MRIEQREKALVIEVEQENAAVSLVANEATHGDRYIDLMYGGAYQGSIDKAEERIMYGNDRVEFSLYLDKQDINKLEQEVEKFTGDDE